MLQKEQIQKIYFLTFFLLFLGLAAHLFSPFITVLILSLTASIMLRNLYNKLEKKFNSGNIASSLSLLVLAIFILIPLTLLINIFVVESQSVYQSISNGAMDGQFANFYQSVNNLLTKIDPQSSIDIGQYISGGATWLAKNIGTFLITNTPSFLFGFFILFVCTFFLLKDGKTFARFFHDLSPLEEKYDAKIFNTITAAVKSIFKGVFFISIIQGLLACIGLWIVGFPNPLFWGIVTGICALIPLIGTGAVMFPAIIYLALTGSPMSVLFLAIWQILIVGLVDNILSPFIYSRGIKVHQLPMLIAMLGGLTIYGAIGFILGPIILAVALSLIEIYKEFILEEKSIIS